ncbi:hypothetical protein, partial [Salmonella enterica]|uniref:hypothetical protein n=1 Tax=Salmonella enterica TaxID=28901 RepID=UPI001F2BBA17
VLDCGHRVAVIQNISCPFFDDFELKKYRPSRRFFSRVSHLWGETTKRAFENSKDTTTKPLHRFGDRKTNSTDAK